MPERLPRPERDHTQRDHDWLSVHLFFNDETIYAEVCDRVLLEVTTPLIEDWTKLDRQWFFIRYGEDGFHVRLRVFGPPGWLTDEARPAIERAAEASARVKRWTLEDYEPEVERYGGPHGVVLAEELFHHSSVTALALLRKIDDTDRSARFGKGLLAMLVQLHIFFNSRDAAAEVAESYGTNYLRAQVQDPRQQELWMETFTEGFDRQADRLAEYVEAAWEALETGEELTPELDLFRRRMQEMATALRELFDRGRLIVDGAVASSWHEAKLRIVLSYLHMMNNRLGVNVREECYLSVLIQRTLECVTHERR